jgi:phosphonoacetaldehyde hydrolase
MTLKAVILDWAGTTIDYGCFAPTMVFVEGFRQFGVNITIEQARRPMGMYKRDHIKTVLLDPEVSPLWEAAHGKPPTEVDVDAIFADFIPRQMQVLAQYSTLIPNTVEAVSAMRSRGLKIGSCTGYTRAMMEVVAPLAEQQGYAPDALICPDDVAAGRPAPFMCYANALQLGVYPMWEMVKIGDTPVDIEEGYNAGMWTIGLAKTGNALGLSLEEVNALSEQELETRLTVARESLVAAGAHYVVDSLYYALPILDEIEHRPTLKHQAKPTP